MTVCLQRPSRDLCLVDAILCKGLLVSLDLSGFVLPSSSQSSVAGKAELQGGKAIEMELSSRDRGEAVAQRRVVRELRDGESRSRC